MQTVIKRIAGQEINEALALIEEVFDQCIAPSYTQEGIETFKQAILWNESFRNKFVTNKEQMYGAYIDEVLVGCVSVSINNTISCLFIKEAYHKKGIGTLMYNYVCDLCKKRGTQVIQLNASSYALPFYKKMGFKCVGDEMVYKGMKYTPMRILL